MVHEFALSVDLATLNALGQALIKTHETMIVEAILNFDHDF